MVVGEAIQALKNTWYLGISKSKKSFIFCFMKTCTECLVTLDSPISVLSAFSFELPGGCS